MKILVLNSGSSSIKAQLFQREDVLFKCLVDGIATNHSKIIFTIGELKKEIQIEIKNHYDAIQIILNELINSKVISNYSEISGIGHRVVHGAELFSDSIIIDETSIKQLEKISDLAPLHNPPNIEGIKICKDLFENVPQVAVFDTSFHSTMDKTKYMYAIPKELYETHKLRKYGFQGTSFKYLTQIASEKYSECKKLIICHLGNGSSICAVDSGKSINTSMGFTPLAGLVMGTRSGDIDAALVDVISKKLSMSSNETISLLNKNSGLKGICGNSDMRHILDLIKSDDKDAKLAFDLLVESILKYVSYYITNLQGVDALIFSAGIGENVSYLREKVVEKLAYLGIRLNFEANTRNDEIISSEDSSALVLVLATNEELMISKEVLRLISN